MKLGYKHINWNCNVILDINHGGNCYEGFSVQQFMQYCPDVDAIVLFDIYWLFVNGKFSANGG